MRDGPLEQVGYAAASGVPALWRVMGAGGTWRAYLPELSREPSIVYLHSPRPSITAHSGTHSTLMTVPVCPLKIHVVCIV